MTHSGHIFAPPELTARLKEKGKAKADIGEREKMGLTANDKAPIEKIVEEGDDFSKREISTEEATEFLRIIQQSEFKVIEQLNKTPAMISLLGLLMNSEPHRALLVKILNEAHVAQDISVEGFRGIVNITTNNSFCNGHGCRYLCVEQKRTSSCKCSITKKKFISQQKKILVQMPVNR